MREAPDSNSGVLARTWIMTALTTRYYLDILAEETGVEAEPVGGDVEPALEKEVPLEGAGTHWEVTGERTTSNKVWREAPGPGSSHSGIQCPALGTVFLKPHSRNHLPSSTPRVFSRES